MHADTPILLRPLRVRNAEVFADRALDGTVVAHAGWTPDLPRGQHRRGTGTERPLSAP